MDDSNIVSLVRSIDLAAVQSPDRLIGAHCDRRQRAAPDRVPGRGAGAILKNRPRVVEAPGYAVPTYAELLQFPRIQTPLFQLDVVVIDRLGRINTPNGCG